MRGLAVFIAVLCVAGAIWLPKSKLSGPAPADTQLLEELLRSTNLEATRQLEHRLQVLEDFSVEVVSRWRGQDRSFRALMEKPEAPRVIWLDGRRVRDLSFPVADELMESFANFANNSRDKMALHNWDGKYWFYLRSYYEGQTVVSLYAADSFWGPLAEGGKLFHWILTARGEVWRHPTTRFLGENAANLKVAARAAEELHKGTGMMKFERFLALDGKEVWGVWASLPSLGLVLVTEWRGAPLERAALGRDSEAERALRWGLLLVGGILLGFAVRRGPRETFMVSAPGTAAASADLAPAMTERWEQLVQIGVPSEFWTAFLKTVANASGATIVSYYRYSSASCTLIPEEHVGLESLDPVAQRYWRESRMLLGAARLLEQVADTEAFDKWNDTRLRFMPACEGGFLFLPLVHAKGRRGLIALFFEAESAATECTRRLLLLKGYARTAAFLYEQKAQLLELMHAKSSKQHPAGAPNSIGSEPRLS